MAQSEVEIIKGSTPTLNFTATQEDGSPLDLTGKTIHVGAKENVSDQTPLFDKTTSNGDVNGNFSVTLTISDTQNAQAKDYIGGVKIDMDAQTFLMAEFGIKIKIGVYS